MQSKALEILVGFFFTLGVAAIFILTFRVASLNTGNANDSYRVSAAFQNIGGLRQGAQVTLAGVRIGRVHDIVIDRDTFEARVTMDIGKQFDNIPKDSNAQILTAGLLGEQYVGLSPGGDPEALKTGDVLKFTQSALVLENLIGQFLVSKASDSSSSDSAKPAPAK